MDMNFSGSETDPGLTEEPDSPLELEEYSESVGSNDIAVVDEVENPSSDTMSIQEEPGEDPELPELGHGSPSKEDIDTAAGREEQELYKFELAHLWAWVHQDAVHQDDPSRVKESPSPAILAQEEARIA